MKGTRVTVDPKNVIELTDAALAADYTRVRRAANLIARGLSTAGEDAAAKTLRSVVRKRGVPLRASGYIESVPVDAKSRLPLLEEQPWPEAPLLLDEEAGRAFHDFVRAAQHIDELSAKGLASRLGLLLSGPPGTGKTLMAAHVAAQLSRPFYAVRLDAVISSLLGDTAKNVRTVFDFVPSQNAVLLLDEMDAVAKLRDDRHELGELKRVVNTVIQGLDSLDQHAVVIAATNHPHLLDPAIWRRFPYKIELGYPDVGVREDLWRHFLFEDHNEHNLSELFATISAGLSGADIEAIGLTARRHALLDSRPVNIASVALAAVESQASKVALPQSGELNTAQKKALAQELRGRNEISGANISRLIGVTRQAVYSYLRQDEEAEHG
ncbi:MAG: ATP-binding protein [Rhodospirillaceae bacterium]|nr:ATP-binding protein [Rhodospirillaceae bacterium]